MIGWKRMRRRLSMSRHRLVLFSENHIVTYHAPCRESLWHINLSLRLCEVYPFIRTVQGFSAMPRSGKI